MKVLWITLWGTWSKPLLKRLKDHLEIEVIVPYEGNRFDYSLDSFDGIPIHNLVLPRRHGLYKTMDYGTYSIYREIIDRIKPDIIHIHGTEKNLAQIQNYCSDIPIVISIQGLLSGCLRYNSAFLSEKEMLPYTSLKNRLKRGGLLAAERLCLRGYNRYEKNIIANGKLFIGRTTWDKAHIKMINPGADYYYGEEILRQEFYDNQGQWSLNRCRPHSIMMPSGYNPLKGMHFAIYATALLKTMYPDVLLKIPGIPERVLKRRGLARFLFGEEYIEYCKALILQLDLQENVVFLPYLSAEEMVEEMLKSHVFLSCSTIENSSNATAEAALLGVPMVMTAVGGLLSLYRDKETTLFAPSGDYSVMSFLIEQIFADDNLANGLSSRESQDSIMRHDPDIVSHQYIDIYRGIKSSFNE